MTGVLEALFLPPAGLLLLGAAGLLALRRRPRLGWTLVGLALAGGVAVTSPFVAAALLISLQSAPALPPEGPLPEADAVVVLGADLNPWAAEYGGATPGPLSLERLRYGARLARRAELPVLVTGGPLVEGSPALGALMAEALRAEYGLEPRWVEQRAANTRQNAQRAAELLAADGADRVLLVTHAWHMPRAARAFRVAGLGVVPAPTVRRAWPPLVLGSFLPSPRSLQEARWALHEWLGRAWYALTE